MTECSSLRTTMTMIIDTITVDQDGTEGGGITIATRQIWMESMETQNSPKGSIGIPGKASITQWKKSEWWFENPRDENYKDFMNKATRAVCPFFRLVYSKV